MDKTPRSDKYQFLFQEISVDFTDPANSNLQGDAPHVNSNIDLEHMATLDQAAFQRMSYLIVERLTRIQSQTFQLLLQGKTQMEISKQVLGHAKTNANISKVIHGAQIPTRQNSGLVKQIPRICLVDEVYRTLLLSLIPYSSSSIMYCLTRSWFSDQDEFLDWTETEIHPQHNIPLWKIRVMFKMANEHYHNLGQTLPGKLSYNIATHIHGALGTPACRQIRKLYIKLLPEYLRKMGATNGQAQ